MLPISDTGLVVILALTATVTVAGFSFVAVLTYKAIKGADEVSRIARAVTAVIYQDDEKSRALLLDPHWP